MRHLKALFLATVVVTGLVAAGCSGDDDANQATNVTPDGGDVPVDPNDGGTTPNPQPDGSTPDPDGGNPNPASSFPAYVKSLIDTKTSDKGLPEGEAAWGAIADDDKPATSSALFPPAYFQ